MKIAQMAVTLVDSMGSDLTVVNAARVSFAKESEWVIPHGTSEQYLSEADGKLIHYLAKHNHWTPFGHAFATFRIKAPIFVARQLVKHQVGLVWNEESRRYIDSEPEFWFPETWRARPDGSIKQGSGAGTIERIKADGRQGEYLVKGLTEYVARDALRVYNLLIEGGVAPEQARMVLPLNCMTEWYWSGSLAAWGRVCKLRLDPHAQKETAEIAAGISLELQTLFPVAFNELMS